MQVFYYDSLDSTNDAAKRLIRGSRITETAYVVAEEQTAGKGTRGRTWSSPKHAGLYLSVIELSNRASHVHPSPAAFTIAAGVACAETLRRVVGVPVELKPVNDIYLHGKKLGGILTEALVERGAMTALITGIGINIRHASRELPSTAAAISLEDVLSSAQLTELDVRELAAAIANDVHELNNAIFAGEFDRVKCVWESYVAADLLDTVPEITR